MTHLLYIGDVQVYTRWRHKLFNKLYNGYEWTDAFNLFSVIYRNMCMVIHSSTWSTSYI